MSILTTDLRNRRQQYHAPAYRSIAHFYTDTKKSEMKDYFAEELFFGNIHPYPDLLKKNLADTLHSVTHQELEMASLNESKLVNNNNDSKLSGLTSFISGVFSVVTSVVFKRPKSPDSCLDSQMPSQMATVDNCQQANDKNELGSDVNKLNFSVMTDCKTPAASYEAKLRKLFETDFEENLTRHKQYLKSNLGDDWFEDAQCNDEYSCLLGNPHIEYYTQFEFHKEQFCEIDVPKNMVQTQKICDLPENMSKNNQDIVSNYVEITNKLTLSCENKDFQLKDCLFDTDKDTIKSTKLWQTKSAPVDINAKDKRFKNHHRLCTKRPKMHMKKIIEDEMLFADEFCTNDDLTSPVEESPSFHSLEKWSESPQNIEKPNECFDEISGRLQLGSSQFQPDSTASSPDSFQIVLTDVPKTVGKSNDYFDEISGKFQPDSAASSADSFQIVFSDVPKRVRSYSDCDSEDSFIVFEDQPDCFTTNDVFCESDDSSDSDSDDSDSGCGTIMLSQSLSRTVSNLTDDSLYHEVDFGNHLENRKFATPSIENVKEDLPVKRVRFSPLPPKVHVMHVWAFAARQARVGHWERYALDRERFKKRIADVEMALSWVLKPQHRTRVMFQRFMPWWNAEKRKKLAVKKNEEEMEKAKKKADDEVQESVEQLQSKDCNIQVNTNFQVGPERKQLEIITKETEADVAKEKRKERKLDKRNKTETVDNLQDNEIKTGFEDNTHFKSEVGLLETKQSQKEASYTENTHEIKTNNKHENEVQTQDESFAIDIRGIQPETRRRNRLEIIPEVKEQCRQEAIHKQEPEENNVFHKQKTETKGPLQYDEFETGFEGNRLLKSEVGFQKITEETKQSQEEAIQTGNKIKTVGHVHGNEFKIENNTNFQLEDARKQLGIIKKVPETFQKEGDNYLSKNIRKENDLDNTNYKSEVGQLEIINELTGQCQDESFQKENKEGRNDSYLNIQEDLQKKTS